VTVQQVTFCTFDTRSVMTSNSSLLLIYRASSTNNRNPPSPNCSHYRNTFHHHENEYDQNSRSHLHKSICINAYIVHVQPSRLSDEPVVSSPFCSNWRGVRETNKRLMTTLMMIICKTINYTCLYTALFLSFNFIYLTHIPLFAR
jgi:hypothetical protein